MDLDRQLPLNLQHARAQTRRQFLKRSQTGLGAIALDLMAAVFVSSLLRSRISPAAWRGVHWLAYGCWPIALIYLIILHLLKPGRSKIGKAQQAGPGKERQLFEKARLSHMQKRHDRIVEKFLWKLPGHLTKDRQRRIGVPGHCAPNSRVAGLA